jgi:transposase
MEKLTQIILAWELFGQGVPKTHIAKHLGRNRETIILWLQGIEEQGLTGFLEHHQKANKQPRPARQVRVSTKQLI